MASENLVAQSAHVGLVEEPLADRSPNWPSTASRPAAMTLPDDVSGA